MKTLDWTFEKMLVESKKDEIREKKRREMIDIANKQNKIAKEMQEAEMAKRNKIQETLAGYLR